MSKKYLSYQSKSYHPGVQIFSAIMPLSMASF